MADLGVKVVAVGDVADIADVAGEGLFLGGFGDPGGLGVDEHGPLEVEVEGVVPGLDVVSGFGAAGIAEFGGVDVEEAEVDAVAGVEAGVDEEAEGIAVEDLV
jgi:hypothetical protein